MKHLENYTLDIILLRYLLRLDPMFLSFNFMTWERKKKMFSTGDSKIMELRAKDK